MRSLDTAAARMDALADAIRTLAPAVVAIRGRHGPHLTRLALRAALDECECEMERLDRQRPAPALWVGAAEREER